MAAIISRNLTRKLLNRNKPVQSRLTHDMNNEPEIIKQDGKHQLKSDSNMDKVEDNVEIITEFMNQDVELTAEDMELIDEFLNV